MGDKRGGWSGKTLVWLPNSKLNSECTEEGALCGSNGRRDLSPIQVRFVGVQQYSHAKCFHASIRAFLFSPSVTHRNSFVHPPHNDSLIRQKYIDGTLSLAFVFLSILIITIGATRTREEFRESREIDTYAYTLGKYVHMACVFRETHPRKCLQIFKWQTCV